MASWSPSRPLNERDAVITQNGCQVFLGCLASTGAVVDNSTTANKFNYQVSGTSYLPTLAGRVLMFQPDAAGYVLPSSLALGSVGVITLVAQANTVIAGGATACGPLVQLAERVLITMGQVYGWVQWLPSGGGNGNCYVWELV